MAGLSGLFHCGKKICIDMPEFRETILRKSSLKKPFLLSQVVQSVICSVGVGVTFLCVVLGTGF